MTAAAETSLRDRAPDVLDHLLVRTPTVPLDDPASGCTIWLKLEYLQPSGSTKDRLAVFVLRQAIERGEVTDGTLVVEASSGSTSIAFAMVCARLGLRFRAVMPEGVSAERQLIIRRYGGEVVLTPQAEGIAGAMAETERLLADGGVYLPRQFSNPANVEAHARTTGPELLEAVAPHHLDGFVASVGTAGTLMGVATALRRADHDTWVAAVRPTTGTTCFAGQPEVCGGFSSGIPGVVEGMSNLLDPAAVGLGPDLDVDDTDALAAARELCARGFPVGLSSGLNLAGARVLATRLGPGHHVGTVLCDRMERYFSAGLFDDLSPA